MQAVLTLLDKAQTTSPPFQVPDTSEQSVIDKHLTMTLQQHVLELGKQHENYESWNCKRNADKKHFVLPLPAYNVMSAHLHPANELAMQECILLPVLAPSGLGNKFHLLNLSEEDYPVLSTEYPSIPDGLKLYGQHVENEIEV
ncbi:hypothetical protein TIFTF001_009979 [Ficus carica]|uniref:Uncharacterized protein n=1 Tax=Ficus carica TaxID=3494 RepID=A0AA87ZXC7_FICCA|nr:hypothetical protein TIFTF001_009979 [Ficus carica]